MKLSRLNHIGVATPFIAGSMAHYRDVLGATDVAHPFGMPELGVYLTSIHLNHIGSISPAIACSYAA